MSWRVHQQLLRERAHGRRVARMLLAVAAGLGAEYARAEPRHAG